MKPSRVCRLLLLTALAITSGLRLDARQDERLDAGQRPPKNDADLRSWLENMVWHHRFTAEITAATGLNAEQIAAALKTFDIRPETRPKHAADAPLLVLPYPGGRHPRIGFLDGAIDPQRETKVSVFAPWDDASYVVVDVPEAIWCQHGLLYLAHTHVPTLWTKQKIELEKLEWNRRNDSTLDIERKLPNNVVFGTKIIPGRDGVRMELWLTNGSKERLTDLRVQNCVLLKGAKGFEAQNNDNKVFRGPYAAARSPDGKRWIITAWDPLHRAWANDKCPCLHSDPRFPDCPPGDTRRLRGWLSFYEGNDLDAEIRRIEQTGWRADKPQGDTTLLRGEIVDADTGKLIPARVYLQSAKGDWLFPRSEAPTGSAIPYKKQRADNPKCAEMHTSLSAHPFAIHLTPGKYTLTIERGHEYLTFNKEVVIGKDPVSLKIPLKRWINLAERGWYSGETHVHRHLDELPTLMLAEDLNVAFPLTHWVTEAFAPPRKGSPDAGAKLIKIDNTHVIYPRNTEYEIFTIGKDRHTLGAFFVINHKKIFEKGVPPVGPIAEQAHAEDGLIELDKPNWPWSMILAALMRPDLYELTNNHVWRTEFGFPAFGEPPPDYMKVQRDAKGFTEWGWIDFTLQNYYTLLNCGIKMRPTAGTASGVHPVPLGFGRVYVECPKGFSYETWLKGLNQGRSFVTTGPMLFVKVNDQRPGYVFEPENKAGQDYRVTGSVHSVQPLNRIEIVLNGEVAKTLKPGNKKNRDGAYDSAIDDVVKIAGSAWLVVRCFEDRPDQRIRFAHSAPWHIEVAGQPLRPRKAEVDFLIRRVQEQIDRSEKLLPAAAQAEYREALKVYRKIAETAR